MATVSSYKQIFDHSQTTNLHKLKPYVHHIESYMLIKKEETPKMQAKQIKLEFSNDNASDLQSSHEEEKSYHDQKLFEDEADNIKV